IEQRFKCAEVRTLQKEWMSSRFQLAETAARNPFLVLWGRVIDKRARPAGFNSLKPSPHCPPAAQAKKTSDLQDPKSASVSAQTGEAHLFLLHAFIPSFIIHHS
ncbi:MAG: hypothetical protein II768_02885, partial [Clostridia bacterium]|nr:hypothetical protein [Clostridia bacterium]